LPAWSALGLSEQREIWDRFDRTFNFRPSVRPADFPGIDEPSPSVTFALPRDGAQKRLPTADDIEDLESATLAAFRACTEPGDRMYALDWQHEGFRLQPHVPFEEWLVPVLPDGDYYIFLAADFTWGLFGHPWEWTMCVFGGPLLAALERRSPRLFDAPARRR
jgi:Protein of unknown function (DUF2716)